MRRYRKRESMSWPWTIAVVFASLLFAFLFMGRLLIEVVIPQEIYTGVILGSSSFSMIFLGIGIIYDATKRGRRK